MFERSFPPSFLPKKRLGQNFLIDKRSLEKIVSYAEISPNDTVLEVGSGLGALTQLLQDKAKRVIAVEKDPELVSLLYRRFHDNPKVEVVNADILRIDPPKYDKVVATPPYNISSKLLFLLLKRKCRSIVLTFQKEFAERLVAKPGTRSYGRLSVTLNHKANTEILDYIPREAFRPKPKVDSAIVKITPKETEQTVNEELFADLVRGLFTQRRRNLRSALKHYIEKRIGGRTEEMLGLDLPDRRVYQLSVEEFEELTQKLTSLLSA